MAEPKRRRSKMPKRNKKNFRPTEEAVLQMHVPKMENGTIKDWAASCGPMTLMFNEPPKMLEPPVEELQT